MAERVVEYSQDARLLALLPEPLETSFALPLRRVAVEVVDHDSEELNQITYNVLMIGVYSLLQRSHCGSFEVTIPGTF